MTETNTPIWYTVGVGREEITPPVGTSLAGFFHDRVSLRVRDPLFARAMVIAEGGTSAAIVGLDLICVDDDFVADAKAQIAREFGIAPECVLISASHTHTGPEVRRVGNKVPVNSAWREQLTGRIVAAVRQAAGSMTRAQLRPGRVETDGYVFNRIHRLPDGSERMGKPSADSLGPAGPVDPALQTLGAVDEDGALRGLLVNLGMHPVTVAGGNADFLSADWPGALAHHVAAVYGPEAVALFLQGSCGDTHHVPYGDTWLPTYGPAKTEQLGRGLAGAAIYAHERAEPMTRGGIRGRLTVIDVPYYTRTPEIWAEIAALKARDDLDAAQAYLVKAVEEWPFDGKSARVPVATLAIGDLALVGIPGQIFTRIGLEMKSWSPYPHTMIVELANARVTSYIPTADQVERGAYGSRPVVSRWLCADAGRRIADTVQVALHQMRAEG